MMDHKLYTREEVGYVPKSPNFETKCGKCEFINHGEGECERLIRRDNDVSSDGTCRMFKGGKHIIIDKEKDKQTRLERHLWAEKQRRKQKIKQFS